MLRESVLVEFKVRDSFVCSEDYQEIFCYQEELLGLFVKVKMIDEVEYYSFVPFK